MPVLPAREPDSSPRPRVAIVDDDPGIRRALARLLRADGYDVRTFGSADDFLASCVPADLDCLLLDVYLGGVTGYDLYARVAAEGQPPPTIFITAYDDAIAQGRQALPADTACLRKPFEEDSLLAAIEAARRRTRPQ